MKKLYSLLAAIMMINSSFASVNTEKVYHPEISLDLDESGSSVNVTVSNLADDALICEPLSISVSFIREEFDLPAGNYSPMGTSFFLYPKEVFHINNIVQDEVSRLRAKNQSIRVYNASSIPAFCRKASFNDYCKYAKKTESESKTMDVLSYVFAISDCDRWMPSSIRKVTLTGAGIEDLYPLTFFENLEVLRLGDNPIQTTLMILQNRKLKKVCLQGTMVPKEEFQNYILRNDCR